MPQSRLYLSACKSQAHLPQNGPLGPTIADLDRFLVSDLAGYTVEQLGLVPASRVYISACKSIGVAGLQGAESHVIELLAPYTILALDAYTIEQLDTLI